MKIQCPSCDQRLEIPEELAGQTIECPACNASLAVPSLATPPPSPVQVQQSAPQVTASEKPKSSIPKWAIASVAGIAVLVVSLIMFFPKDLNDVSSSEPTKVKTDGESQQSTSPEAKPIERVLGAKAPDISIHEAVGKGRIETVKQHLTAGTDVNVKNDDGLTALNVATYFKNKEIAEFLISKGADVNTKEENSLTPLHLTAFDEYKEIAELLIANGAEVDIKDKNGLTPLHLAAIEGQKEIAELLIVNGAEVDIKDKNGFTPLHYSVGSGHKIVSEFLIAKGAYVNAKDEDGMPPIDMAIELGEQEIADLLRKHGAKTAEELKAESK